MKYIINYTKEGKILGFTKGDTGLNIEVSNAIWFEAQGFNKIIIDNTNVNFVIDGKVDDIAITFDKIDWRTDEEIQKEFEAEFRAKRNVLLDKVDKAINIAEDLGQDSKALRTYRQELRDATLTWVIPEGVS